MERVGVSFSPYERSRHRSSHLTFHSLTHWRSASAWAALGRCQADLGRDWAAACAFRY